MTAATYHFEVNTNGSPYIEQGADFLVPLVFKDSAGAAIDVTGYTARMHIRASRDDAATLLELTNANGRLVIGGANGTVTIKLTALETAAFTWTKGVYDLELVRPDGFVTRALEGRVSISKEVTREAAL